MRIRTTKRRAVLLGLAAFVLAATVFDPGLVAGVVKRFVPGSLPFLALAVCCGAFTMAIWKSSRKVVVRSLLALGLVYLVLAWPWTAHRLASPLIEAAVPIETADRAAIAVLTGDHDVARLEEGARLYHRLQPQWVIVSGDAEFRSGLVRRGVPAGQLLWDDHPVSTRQQALNLRRITDAHRIDEVILVVSPLHMTRALAATQAAGVRARPAPSSLPHLRLPRSGLRSFVPSLEALRFSWESLYEYLGLIYYRARGWLTPPVSSFPG